MNIQIPAQSRASKQAAATAASAPAASELGWGRVLRVSVARASLALVASLVLWSVLPVLVGWTPRVILSGSMEPRVHVGDIIVTRTVPAASLTKGQVITVIDPDHPGKTRTHRLLRVDSNGMLVLKGDANPQADSSHVSPHALQGLGVVRIPYVGRPAYWMAERNWLALGATTLFLGWCIVTASPGSRRSEDTTHDDGPTTRSGPLRRSPRRVAATVAVAAFAVGAASGPADAAFRLATANPSSALNAANDFHPSKTVVLADSPYLFWQLDETSGTAIDDAGSGNHDGTLLAQSYTLGQAGALASETTGTSLGLTQGMINANASVAGPNPFSVEAWVKTSSTTGGRILGFGNATGASSSTTVDRQLYLAPDGKVMFGIGSAKTALASTAPVNDNQWHHVVGTYKSGNNGMRLYVDGANQGKATATAQSFTGYWRAGFEHLTGWQGNPTGDYFVGNLDELAVYTTDLTAGQVQTHYTAGVTP